MNALFLSLGIVIIIISCGFLFLYFLYNILSFDKKLFLFLGVSSALVGLYFLYLSYPNQEYNYHVYEEKIQLKTLAVKNELVEEIDKYIKKNSQNSSLEGIVIVDNCEKFNIDVCFVLAQGHKESHFGTQGLARKTNSVFNVYAYDGKKVEDIHPNGVYKTPNASVEPYLNLLTKKYLVNKSEYDLLEKYVNKDGKRYASDPNYEQQLTSIYFKIKQETKIDSLQNLYKYYKMLL